jgi:hypothetical protein
MTSTNVAKVPPLSDDEVVAVCYLCHDGGTDEADQPLRRDCACRGTDAGFVHLSCLAEFASYMSKGWDGGDTNQFRKPWEKCPSCHQIYQNELAIDIASKFVSFVRGTYPHDTLMQVESIFSKLNTLLGMLKRLQPVQKKEVEDAANLLLSLIDRMKNDASLLPMRYSQMEANAYNALGVIAINEGSEESARRALAHIEKALEINKAIGCARGIAIAKANIAIARLMYDSVNNDDELYSYPKSCMNCV